MQTRVLFWSILIRHRRMLRRRGAQVLDSIAYMVKVCLFGTWVDPAAVIVVTEGAF